MSVETSVGLDPVRQFVAALADNKLFLGRRYAEWCTAAPTLESAVAAAAMAQDEIGHARSLYPVLRELAGVSSETEPETRSQFLTVSFLRTPFFGWTDFIAANLLLDTALSVSLEAARESSLHDLATRARRILGEEPFHWLHGAGWTQRLAERGERVREALQGSIDRAAPDALMWFGYATPELVERNILDTSRGDLWARFRSQINAVLDPSGLRPL